jgi:hypothetical protein
MLQPMGEIIADEEINVCWGHRIVGLKSGYNMDYRNAGNAGHTSSCRQPGTRPILKRNISK